MSEIEEELKPCPFCGTQVTIRQTPEGNPWVVLHHGVMCPFKMEIFAHFKDVVVKYWNTRIPSKQEEG